MSSPKFDTALDDLFRKALVPIADQEAPGNAWERLVSAVQMPPVERTTWETLLERLIPPQRGYSAARHRLTSWVQCFMTYYPPSSTHQTYWGSDGRRHPSPFAGAVLPQILDLRHAS
ncbi:MAG: hypothetical protein MUQ10_04150 [Anaerolineae bacterium]|nr:hypothetical protein [Anaerolineae bacterium]